MNGILGTWNLYQNINQAVYVNNNDQASNITVNICNKNKSEIKVYVAVSEYATLPMDAEWVEYDVTVYPNGVLLRSGLMVPTGYYVVVKSTGTFTNVVVYGQETGESVEAPVSISENLGSAPVWSTSSSFFYDSEKINASYQLSALDPESGELSYSLVSGTLPSGTSLSSSGLISGLTTGIGSSTATVRATDVQSNSANKTFTIIKRYLDGSTAELAAPSGYYISQYITGATSGYYWIKSSAMPTALQMYVDMTEDGGGYDFYPFIDNAEYFDERFVTSTNSGKALGLDIVYPRSKYHWRAMSNFVYAVLGKRGQAYQNFFRTCYGVYKETGGGNFTSTIMRDATYYGSGSTSHRVPDGGRWWLRDSTFSEPNGDYDATAFFGLNAGGYTFPEPYALQDIGFNDGSSSYSLGKSYLVSTNTKP